MFGTRILSEDEYQSWDRRYQEASSALDDREAAVEALSAELEQDLELVGVAAVEDKLQVRKVIRSKSNQSLPI